MARAEKACGDLSHERRVKMAEDRKKELTGLREKIMAGTKDSVMDQFGDVLNSSANRVKKTKVELSFINIYIPFAFVTIFFFSDRCPQ